MKKEMTSDVKMLLGNPKKAIIAMSIPIIIAMIAQSANNLIDSVWVAGLGPNALAAVGLVFPLFFIIIGIGNGIGIGASSAIGRRIGRKDKDGADRTASQSIGLTVAIGIIVAILLLLIQRPLMLLLGAGDTIGFCIDYGTPIFMCIPILLLNSVFSNLLMAEGAAKRSMMIQILAAIINICLDPIFIYDYGFGMGMAGAAWATVIAVTISLIVMIYWYFVKKNTYLDIKLRGFRFNKEIDNDIFRVGIPSSVEMIFMSFMAMLMNVIIIIVGGTDGVAIYSATWRLIQMIMIPLMAVGSSIVPICAVAYGAKRYDKIKDAYNFSIKFCILIMIILAALVAIFADYLVFIFTYSESTALLKEDIVLCIRMMCIFLPFMAWGFVASGFFQGIGMGLKSLISTILRSGIQIPVCYALAVTAGTLMSIWWGIVATEIAGSVFVGLWSLLILRILVKEYKPRADDNISEN